MLYVSIDLETTGLDPDYCQILEFGAVIDDTQFCDKKIEHLPSFCAKVYWEQVRGEPIALGMNRKLLEGMQQLARTKPPMGCTLPQGFYRPEDLGIRFAEWLNTHGIHSKRIIAAGKNFATFDLRFLRRHPDFMKYCGFHHRVLDPMMFSVLPTDREPPNMNICLDRNGFPSDVKHEAVADAQEVIRLIRAGLVEKQHVVTRGELAYYDVERGRRCEAVLAQLNRIVNTAWDLGLKVSVDPTGPFGGSIKVVDNAIKADNTA